ncbi:hypothetical protein MRX96_022788 [Rhipicephalus microplus]
MIHPNFLLDNGRSESEESIPPRAPSTPGETHPRRYGRRGEGLEWREQPPSETSPKRGQRISSEGGLLCFLSSNEGHLNNVFPLSAVPRSLREEEEEPTHSGLLGITVKAASLCSRGAPVFRHSRAP